MSRREAVRNQMTAAMIEMKRKNVVLATPGFPPSGVLFALWSRTLVQYGMLL
jgi:hypothetical protein